MPGPTPLAVPGTGRTGEDADVLQAVNPVKTAFKKNSSGRGLGQGGSAFGLDAVPFTPSQGIARTPSNSTSQFNFDPQQLWGWSYGARPPESPSMGRKGSDPNHPTAFPFPPYFMAYSMPYAEETDPAYVPPSPLMGSPVGTPTAMMFPQTPFAGAHSHPPHPFSPYPGRGSQPFAATSPTRSPSYMDAYAPMSPNNYGCFHPMFNSFPAFPLAPLQQNNGTSPRKGHAGSSLYSSNSSTQGSATADREGAPHGTAHGAAAQQQQQQQQQQRKSERAGEDADGLGFDFGPNLGPGWGPWGGKFSPFSFPPPPHYFSTNSTLTHTSSGSFCMPMHLLQPLYALSSMGSIGPHWPAPGPPSPRTSAGSSHKGPGRAASSAMSAQLLASQQHHQGETTSTNNVNNSAAGGTPPINVQAAASRSLGGSSRVSHAASHTAGEGGAGADSPASSVGGGGSGHKGPKPRPPPLQLNMISGMGGAAGGIAPIPPMPIPIPAPSTPGTPPAPAQQPLPSLPSMPFPFSAWEGPMPDLPPPSADQPFSPTRQHLPPFVHPLNPPMPTSAPPQSFAPPPFCPVPPPYSMPPHPFMPMPMHPYLLPPNMHPGAMLPFPLLPPHLAPPFPGIMPGHPSNIPPHPFTHPRHSHGTSHMPHPRHPRSHAQQHLVHSVHGSPPNAGGVGPKPGGKPRAAQAGGQAGSNPANIGAAKGDAQPRLNARQRRTLRRAKERAIRGLMEAGHLALKQQQQAEGHPTAQQKLPEDKEGEDLSGSDTDEAARAAAAVDNAAASSFFSAAMSVVAGSHGPEAAANASEAISKVAADLDDIDLTNLISHLSQRKGETHGQPSGAHAPGPGSAHSQAGAPGQAGPHCQASAASHPTEETLLRDLQIIQNLIGLLKAQQGGPVEGAGGKEGLERGAGGSEQRAVTKGGGAEAEVKKGAAGGAGMGRQGVPQAAQIPVGPTAAAQQQQQQQQQSGAGVAGRAHEGPGSQYNPLKLTQQMRTVC